MSFRSEIVGICALVRFGRVESEDGFVRATVIIISVPNRPVRTRPGQTRYHGLSVKPGGGFFRTLKDRGWFGQSAAKSYFPFVVSLLATASLLWLDKPTRFPRISRSDASFSRFLFSLPLPSLSTLLQSNRRARELLRTTVAFRRTNGRRKERKMARWSREEYSSVSPPSDRSIHRRKRIEDHWLPSLEISVDRPICLPICLLTRYAKDLARHRLAVLLLMGLANYLADCVSA